jgi:hypothetical protein
MFATTPPDVSVFTNKSYVASKPTPAAPAEGVIDLFHLHPLLHNPNIIIPIHRKECWFETLHTPEQKWYHLAEAHG